MKNSAPEVVRLPDREVMWALGDVGLTKTVVSVKQEKIIDKIYSRNKINNFWGF